MLHALFQLRLAPLMARNRSVSLKKTRKRLRERQLHPFPRGQDLHAECGGEVLGGSVLRHKLRATQIPRFGIEPM
jgi:hypothetical protein